MALESNKVFLVRDAYIFRVILPERNKKDVDEISKEIRDNIT